MKVILLDNIKGIGQVGDVKNVNDGYARNFLLPKRMARPATDSAIKNVEAFKNKRSENLALRKENASKIAEQLKDQTIEFTKKTSETGKLFASLNKDEIAKKLSKLVGAKIESDMLDLKEHGEYIKQTGEHIIEVALTPETKIDVKLLVKSE